MKKIYALILLSLLVLLPGCTKVEEGKYKEGTYLGVDKANEQIAVIYVDKSGLIKSVFIDAAYAWKQDDGTTVSTTKQILKSDYGMKSASANMGIIEGGAEWYEQADNFAEKVVDEQDLDWFEYKYRVTNEDGTYTYTSDKPDNQTEADKLYTDTVAGVTIHVNGCYNAVKNALDQAKK